MAEMKEILGDLVIANRILAHENVVDAFGNVSLRHPDKPERFFLARARSPEVVERDDLLEFEARPDVQSVIHNHAEEVIPFSVTGVPLRPVSSTTVRIGVTVPVWDIADRFGDTDILVGNIEQARDLAATLADNRVVLMRGHGATVATPSLRTAVEAAIYAKVNARMQAIAMQMGTVKYLTPGELALKKDQLGKDRADTVRTWEYFCRRAGFDDA